ncbi:hypothetical protein [Streptomyces sp900116325]|uniref:hypothetical protein n=1 Tax=Streptomyces sp. 900116325 TaxID=3154295 RepID=UPI0033E482B9
MPPERAYTLLGADGVPYRSTTPGSLGGHRRGRLYGRLDCPSALRALARGHYVARRVFFPDETTAIRAGYRPCAVCLPARYARWKRSRESASIMDTLEERQQQHRSPLIPASDLAEYGDLPFPSPHTEAELTALIDLLRYPGSRIETVSVGHSRDDASGTAAEAFTTAWQAGGGTVLAVVDWPESAASWLRPATRLTRQTPDAWVIAAAPLGFAQLARRLRRNTDWAPDRTVAFTSLQDTRLLALAGADVLDGLRGASADGGTWSARRGWVTSWRPAPTGGTAARPG